MRNVRRYGWRTAMIDPIQKKTWTYRELNADVNRLTNRLMTDGLKKGDCQQSCELSTFVGRVG